ncbi:MAG: hypothetical protein ACTS73_09695 [Arsenophonus sp. NEOnobi-MAG3]
MLKLKYLRSGIRDRRGKEICFNTLIATTLSKAYKKRRKAASMATISCAKPIIHR